MEAWLETSADDREAVEGLRAMGPANAAAMANEINRDIDLLTATDNAQKGKLRRLSVTRFGVAATIVFLFGAGYWMLTVIQQRQKDQQAFERHFEPVQLGQTESGAFTESGIASDTSVKVAPLSGGTWPGAQTDKRPSDLTTNTPSGNPENFSSSVTDQDIAGSNDRFDEKASSYPITENAPAVQEDFLDVAPAPVSKQEEALSIQSDSETGVVSGNAPGAVVSTEAARGSRKDQESIADVSDEKNLQNDQPETRSKRETSEKAFEEPASSNGIESASETETFSRSWDAPQNTGWQPAPDPFEQGRRAYDSGDFRMATDWFGAVPHEHPRKAEAQLLEANAWLQRGKPERAEPLLVSLVNAGQGPLLDQSRWYLALTRIALGKPAEARPLLLLLESGGEPLSNKAKELLLEIGR